MGRWKKKLFKKKTLGYATLIVMADMLIGTLAIEHFNLIEWAQKHNEIIVHSTIGASALYLLYLFYKKRFARKKLRYAQIMILKGKE